MKFIKRGIICLFFLACAVFISSCGQEKKQAPAPNANVTYIEGADITGVVRALDTSNMMISIYNPLLETEETFLYSGGTEVLTRGGMEMVMDEVECGDIFDVYVDDTGTSVEKMQQSENIVTEEDAVVSFNPDAMQLEVEGNTYAYTMNLVVVSGDKLITPEEITAQDRVTFHGIKGKAYSVVVTTGHGYLQPVNFRDFIGGTLTVEGEAIVPVSEGMLLTVQEGKHGITFKNGDLVSTTTAKVKRNKVTKVDIGETSAQLPETARVTFKIRPEGADLYVNGVLTDYSKPVSMRYGKHSLKVVLEGYYPYTGSIDVRDPAPGVRIDLAEESAAIDNSSNKSSSEKNSSSNSSVSSADDSSSDGSGDEAKTGNVVGEYDTDHQITVSAPAGAAVYVDGTFKGTAPCSFMKMIGNVTLTLTMEGYETKSYSFEIADDGEDLNWSFPKLSK